MTFQEVREDLRKMQVEPDQWVVMLEAASSMIESNGFNNLTEFVTSPWGKGGLGLTLEQAKTLAYYNPQYKHKAEKVCKKLGLTEVAKGVPVLNDHGEVGNGRCAKIENGTPTQRGSNQATYRIAKLKRDHPDIAQRLIDGEFDNVADAERAAGTKPPKVERKQVWLPVNDLDESANKMLSAFGLEWCKMLSERLR